MFERFTERARQVVVLAQAEARERQFGHIGTESLLLGLLREEEGVATRVLQSMGVDVARAREAVGQRVKGGDEPPAEMLPFTPRAKQALAQAAQEATNVGRTNVDSEHILLALVTVDESEAINALRSLEVDAQQVRTAVIRELSSPRVARMAPRSSSRARDRSPARPLVPDRWRAETGFRVTPNEDALRLLMSTAARALEDGRTEMTARDLLIALARDDRTGPLLASFGADETAILAALDRRDARARPPEANSDN